MYHYILLLFIAPYYDRTDDANEYELIINSCLIFGMDSEPHLVDNIEVGLKKIKPIVEEYFTYDLATIAGKQREWSFAMVAGDQWKIRTFTEGEASVNLAVRKMRTEDRLNDAIEFSQKAIENYPGTPMLNIQPGPFLCTDG